MHSVILLQIWEMAQNPGRIGHWFHMIHYFWKTLGILFLCWGILYEALLLKHTGWDQGLYLWVGNLCVVLCGIALLIPSKSLVIALLSTLILSQSLWIFDNTARAFLGHDFWGLTEALYQPGISLLEFILALHPLFVLPILVLATFVFENKKGHPGRTILVMAVLILPLSYFVFPAEQNINCLHAPCFSALGYFKGKQYSIVFPSLFLLASIGIARSCRSLTTRVLSGKNLKRAFGLFAFVMLLMSTIAGLSLYRKSKLHTPPEKEGVRLSADCVSSPSAYIMNRS